MLNLIINNYVFVLVPDTVIIMNAHSIKIVSKPLILDSNITTVRGITSRVDIVWSSNGLELRKIRELCLI